MPSLEVGVASSAAAWTGAPARSDDPPSSVGPPKEAPTGSRARFDASATHGVDATFHRPGVWERFATGGIPRQEMLALQATFLKPMLQAATLPIGGEFAAPTVSRLAARIAESNLPRSVKYAIVLGLEVESGTVSFANSHLIANSAYRIPTAYTR